MSKNGAKRWSSSEMLTYADNFLQAAVIILKEMKRNLETIRECWRRETVPEELKTIVQVCGSNEALCRNVVSMRRSASSCAADFRFDDN